MLFISRRSSLLIGLGPVILRSKLGVSIAALTIGSFSGGGVLFDTVAFLFTPDTA